VVCAVAAVGSMNPMEQDGIVIAEDTDELIEDELLVEEISIDGMCGVY
jgi:mycofactocin precursor